MIQYLHIYYNKILRAITDSQNVVFNLISSLCALDWLQSLKQFFINVSHHILVASLALMALFLGLVDKLRIYDMTHG